MNSLGIAVKALDEPIGLRPHTEGIPAIHKSKLICYLRIVKTANGDRTELMPFLDIMHGIFHNSLFPRVGNKDHVQSYLVNLLLFCQKERDRESTLDVSHIMWMELRSANLCSVSIQDD
ncbi:Exocyst complex component 7 [Hordeum vulgare]|nr:Exocyst complex component 7 [Hordeum vulgare]